MTKDTRKLLDRIRALLQAAFGHRFRGLVLFGSEARGEATSQSDVDLLVLLARPMNYWQDLKLIVRVLYPLQLELGREIDAFPAIEDDYRRGELAIYRAARKEGLQV